MAAVVLTRDATEVQVVNTTTETDLFSYTIPAGAFGTDRALRLTMGGIMKNDTAGNVNFTIEVILGSTTMWKHTAAFAAVATVYGAWRFDLTISQVDVNEQRLSGIMVVAGRTAITTGLGPLNAVGSGGPVRGTAAEDEATDLTLAVTVEMGTADANAEWTKEFATLELL